MTPLERPGNLADKEFLTEAEVASDATFVPQSHQKSLLLRRRRERRHTPVCRHDDSTTCGLNSGPPILTSAYNNNVQIFQTPEHVALLNEMIYSIRVIPLDGRPHIDDGIRQWKGDSRGRWEGDTRVVDTTNFTRPDALQGIESEHALVERFTRAGDGLLLCEFTIDDPETFTSGWSAVLPMVRADGVI